MYAHAHAHVAAAPVAKPSRSTLPPRIGNLRDGTATVASLGRRGLWQAALAEVAQMRLQGLEIDVMLCNAATSAVVRAGMWDLAMNLLSEARCSGLELDGVAFNAAVTAAQKGAQWQRALAILREMRQRRLQPDVVTFSAATSAAEKGMVIGAVHRHAALWAGAKHDFWQRCGKCTGERPAVALGLRLGAAPAALHLWPGAMLAADRTGPPKAAAAQAGCHHI
ncbi:unnamed protein product [Polarella glacialis]|uniref:Uncharacterized protein n=1 Tax=Polarella glacialis TaxID=89957 RepID=A0A813EVZ2_POLGL|nr:unnamed protein product [Polarella glacialis]